MGFRVSDKAWKMMGQLYACVARDAATEIEQDPNSEAASLANVRVLLMAQLYPVVVLLRRGLPVDTSMVRVVQDASDLLRSAPGAFPESIWLEWEKELVNPEDEGDAPESFPFNRN